MLIIERVIELARASIFASVPHHSLARLAETITEVSVGAGHVVVEQGADEDWMFVLVAGGASVDVDGRHVRDARPGDVIGELAIFDSAPRSATVTTTEPTLLFRIDRAPFRRVLLDHPDIAVEVASVLAYRLRTRDDG